MAPRKAKAVAAKRSGYGKVKRWLLQLDRILIQIELTEKKRKGDK